jgi:hypothetical protein
MTSETTVTEMKARIATPEQAESIRPFGIEMKILMDAEHTGGKFSAIVGELNPGEGPPPHLHREGGVFLRSGRSVFARRQW